MIFEKKLNHKEKQQSGDTFCLKKTKTESNFKNRGQQRTAGIKHVCSAADSKWLLTQTTSLLLHQTKLVFKGTLSSFADGFCQMFLSQYFVCISFLQLHCVFSLT